jgi:hypothetical protein
MALPGILAGCLQWCGFGSVLANWEGRIPEDRIRILLVEGSIGGGYEWGLETGIQLAEHLVFAYSHKIEVMVVGKISTSLQQRWKEYPSSQLQFTGQVPS